MGVEQFPAVTPDERSEIRGPSCRRRHGPRLARQVPLGRGDNRVVAAWVAPMVFRYVCDLGIAFQRRRCGSAFPCQRVGWRPRQGRRPAHACRLAIPAARRRPGWHRPAFMQDFMSRGAHQGGTETAVPRTQAQTPRREGHPTAGVFTRRYKSSARHVWIRARIDWKALPPIRRKDMDRPADRFSGNANDELDQINRASFRMAVGDGPESIGQHDASMPPAETVGKKSLSRR
jgi:hypothetical protein